MDKVELSPVGDPICLMPPLRESPFRVFHPEIYPGERYSLGEARMVGVDERGKQVIGLLVLSGYSVIRHGSSSRWQGKSGAKME
jgi:hypothetical protein